MRKIKFRGTDINGHYVYGLLTKKKVHNNNRLSYAIADGFFTQGETIPISEKNIAQFLGYDKNGKEIYSDDEIKNYLYTLDGKGVCTQKKNAADFFRISDIGKTFNDIELLDESGKNDK